MRAALMLASGARAHGRAHDVASTSPRVRELRPGFCRVEMTERRGLQNPFNSLHAVALTNVGELASGLVLMDVLQKQKLRGIVTKLETEYFRKAKGARRRKRDRRRPRAGEPRKALTLTRHTSCTRGAGGLTPLAGTVSAEATVDVTSPLLPAGVADGTARVMTDIFNKDRDVVARVTAHWNLKRTA